MKLWQRLAPASPSLPFRSNSMDIPRVNINSRLSGDPLYLFGVRALQLAVGDSLVYQRNVQGLQAFSSRKP